MGKYGRIEKYLEQTVPEYAALKIVPRGTPLFPDLLLTGAARFARRLGANFGVLTPDNQVTLTADASIESTVLTIDRILQWFEVNALVTFNGVEMMRISDWDTDHLLLLLQERLTATRLVGEKLTLWATPLVMHLAATAGDNQIVVRSRYGIENGDVVTFPVSDLLNSLKENNVLLSETAGSSGDPEFPYLFLLTLEENLPIDLGTGSSIYLRAYPAYRSKVLNVPKIQPRQLGPFCLDYVATPLDAVKSYSEIFSVRTLSSAGNPIAGTLSALQTIERNFPVWQRPFWAENLLFWQVRRGSGGFQNPNRYLMKVGEDRKARVSTRLVPAFPSGDVWTFVVESDSDGLLRFKRNPYGFQDYYLTAHVPQVVTLSTPPGGEWDRLDIVVELEQPGRQVSFQDSIVTGPVCTAFQYGFVFRVVGTTNFQSTSVIVKPYFLSLVDLTSRYDQGDQYNSGLLYL